jgi:predicted PolB exonuclease-like 3'-5' exonuclease
MATVVFDIETIGDSVDGFDEKQTEFWFKFAETEADEQQLRESTAFFALTGQIVSIALYNPDTDKGKVLTISDSEPDAETDNAKYVYFTDERGMLEAFWQDIRHYQRFVTFNGRVFDCPFVMLRSAILKLRPTRNLCPYRYSTDQHVDLADQLRFYGAVPKAFPLHFYCKAFGIDSPKDGMHGKEVGAYFAAGRSREIAEYCLGDTVATGRLFEYWRDYLNFPGRG